MVQVSQINKCETSDKIEKSPRGKYSDKEKHFSNITEDNFTMKMTSTQSCSIKMKERVIIVPFALDGGIKTKQKIKSSQDWAGGAGIRKTDQEK